MSQVRYGEALLQKADGWATYPSTLTDNYGTTWAVTRCGTCHDAILISATAGPEDRLGTVAHHLITHHGYRMDGRNEKDQETAARAAAERGEMNAYRA